MKQDLFAFDQKMNFQGDLDFEKNERINFWLKQKKEQVATISAVVATAAIAAIAAATSTASKHLESEIFIFVNFPNLFPYFAPQIELLGFFMYRGFFPQSLWFPTTLQGIELTSLELHLIEGS